MKSNMKSNFNTDGRTDGRTKMVVTVSEYCCGRNSARSGKKRVSLVAGLIAALLLTGTPAHADDPTPAPSLVEALRVGLAQAGATSTSTDDTVVNVGSVTVTCYTRNRWERDHWNDGTIGADEWWFTAKHYEHYCAWPNSADSVRLLKSEYRYDFEGDSQNCNIYGAGTHVMKYVKFNSYFSDNAGRNFNPGAKAVTCSKTSHRTVFVYYDTNTLLWTSDGAVPRFRTNYTLVRTDFPGGDTSHSGTLGGALRKCSGRGFASC